MLTIGKLENDKNLLRKHYEDYDVMSSISDVLEDIIDENTIIVNIGTDRVIYDAIAPLIGTYLKNKKCSVPVYGTISNPIHALNLEEKLYKIKSKHPYSTIIGIDACKSDIIGEIIVDNKSINPGSGTGKILPKVGDYSIKITTITNSSFIFDNSTSIRLNDIMEMGEIVGNAILKVVNSKKNNNKEVTLTDCYVEDLW